MCKPIIESNVQAAAATYNKGRNQTQPAGWYNGQAQSVYNPAQNSTDIQLKDLDDLYHLLATEEPIEEVEGSKDTLVQGEGSYTIPEASEIFSKAYASPYSQIGQKIGNEASQFALLNGSLGFLSGTHSPTLISELSDTSPSAVASSRPSVCMPTSFGEVPSLNLIGTSPVNIMANGLQAELDGNCRTDTAPGTSSVIESVHAFKPPCHGPSSGMHPSGCPSLTDMLYTLNVPVREESNMRHVDACLMKDLVANAYRPNWGDIPVKKEEMPTVQSSMEPSKGKTCQVDGCGKAVRSRGRCKAHGGSIKCSYPGCTRQSQGQDRCIRHGGGRRCEVDGCIHAAQSNHRCKKHGGGPRCQFPGCSRSSQGRGLCRTHGGGQRCEFAGCQKGAQRDGFCAAHGGIRGCSIPGCTKNDRGGGLCASHGGGKRCTVMSCNKPARRKGMCSAHFRLSAKARE